jgi:hypothetical protein
MIDVRKARYIGAVADPPPAAKAVSSRNAYSARGLNACAAFCAPSTGIQ